MPLAAELFATTLDAFLLLERIPEDANDCLTADGRPATKRFAHARLARMLGGDGETCSLASTADLASAVVSHLSEEIASALHQVAARLPRFPETIVLAGSGEFLARQIAEKHLRTPAPALVSLNDRLGPDVSRAACAYAVAVLRAERGDGQ
jgi:uncharacterized hydantoinase/oxoprolinase family protein